MPRDQNGVYSLPAGYKAVTGQKVLASQHNGPLEDLAASMTNSLPRTGVAPMTAALQMGGNPVTGMADGSADTDGATVGQVRSAAPVGSIIDYAGSTAPSGWLFCYGQAVSRTDYAALFSAIGTTYGTGDGIATFNIPDLRGRTRAGRDDMGGTDAGILSTFYGAAARTVGGILGTASHVLTIAQLARHTHPGIKSKAVVPIDGWGTSGGPLGKVNAGRMVVGSGSSEVSENLESLRSSLANQEVTLSGDVASGISGNDEAHPNAQPSMIFNAIIRAT